jgi:tRNA threonylcarbamoyladenosine biosynthesis protein TsaB
MPIILSLDTSSTACSVALHVDGRLLAVSDIHKEHSHGGRLALLIKQVLENADVSFQQISCIGLSSGPGSYTGLRIGTSTAKGLCYALNVPLVAVDSLTVMAHHVVKEKRDEIFYCPMLDARRMEVYCAVYNSSLTVLEPIQAKVIDENSFADVLEKGRIVFFGNGAGKCREAIRHSNATFLENINPSAVELGELACEKFNSAKIEDLVHFEPLYLKEFLIKKSSKLDSLLNK